MTKDAFVVLVLGILLLLFGLSYVRVGWRESSPVLCGCAFTAIWVGCWFCVAAFAGWVG